MNYFTFFARSNYTIAIFCDAYMCIILSYYASKTKLILFLSVKQELHMKIIIHAEIFTN